MEFYLVKDTLEFENVERSTRGTTDGLWMFSTANVILQPVAQNWESATAKQFTEALKKSLAHTSSFKGRRMSIYEPEAMLSSSLDVHVFVPHSQTAGVKTGMIEIFYDHEMRYGSNVLEDLDIRIGRQNLSLDVSIDFQCTSGPDADEYSEFNFQSKNVALNPEDCLKIYPLVFPEGFTSETSWKGDEKFVMSLTVVVVMKLSKPTFKKLYLESVPINDLTARNKVLLEEAVGCDLAIVAGDGAEIKCHKAQLMGTSKAFRAMFESKMKQEPHNRLEMLDMSEAGVRAMLRYIYYFDLEAALENCEIAFELLVAANKYGISCLEDVMTLTMTCLEDEWFSMEFAMRLATFAKLFAVEGTKEANLLRKAMQVLRVHFKNSSADFQASEEYQRVFQNDQKSGENLVKLFIEDDTDEEDDTEEEEDDDNMEEDDDNMEEEDDDKEDDDNMEEADNLEERRMTIK